jgi:hypothetical protein
MFKDLEEAAEIVERLQEWIEDRDGLSSWPVANLSWSTTTLQIAIGHEVVYCDQNTNGEDFTFEACKAAWLEHLKEMQPFVEECSR